MIEIGTTDSEILRGRREVEDKICLHLAAQEAVAAVVEVVAAVAVAAVVAAAEVETINLGTPMVLVRNS